MSKTSYPTHFSLLLTHFSNNYARLFGLAGWLVRADS